MSSKQIVVHFFSFSYLSSGMVHETKTGSFMPVNDMPCTQQPPSTSPARRCEESSISLFYKNRRQWIMMPKELLFSSSLLLSTSQPSPRQSECCSVSPRSTISPYPSHRRRPPSTPTLHLDFWNVDSTFYIAGFAGSPSSPVSCGMVCSFAVPPRQRWWWERPRHVERVEFLRKTWLFSPPNPFLSLSLAMNGNTATEWLWTVDSARVGQLVSGAACCLGDWFLSGQRWSRF